MGVGGQRRRARQPDVGDELGTVGSTASPRKPVAARWCTDGPGDAVQPEVDHVGPNQHAVVEERHVSIGHSHHGEPPAHPCDRFGEAGDLSDCCSGRSTQLVDIDEIASTWQ